MRTWKLWLLLGVIVVSIVGCTNQEVSNESITANSEVSDGNDGPKPFTNEDLIVYKVENPEERLAYQMNRSDAKLNYN